MTTPKPITIQDQATATIQLVERNMTAHERTWVLAWLAIKMPSSFDQARIQYAQAHIDEEFQNQDQEQVSAADLK